MSKFRTYMKTNRKQILLSYLQIVLGCAIGGAAYPGFLVPNDIAPGGATGTAMLINHFLPILPIGLLSLVINIPIFLLGLRSMGKVFAFRSLFATFLFSAMIDWLPVPVVTTDPLLGTIFGGVVLGIGSGLVLRGEATTGGSDMLARVIHHRFQHISVGTALFVLEAMVVIAAAFVFDTTRALYALIEIFLCSKVVDTVMLGFSGSKACFIMSLSWERITARIMEEMGRGVTQLNARGAYTQAERPVVLCVVSRQEIQTIKTIVKEEDPDAFLFISEAHEALGEGFAKLDAEN